MMLTTEHVCVCLCLCVSVCFKEGSGEEGKRRKRRVRRASDFIKSTWKENNNAERIFNLLPERDTLCYSALIRGMVMVRTHPWPMLLSARPAGGFLQWNAHIDASKISACLSVSPQHGACAKAFSMFTDMLNNRLTGELPETIYH